MHNQLSHEGNLTHFRDDYSDLDMIDVYWAREEEGVSDLVYCVLVPLSRMEHHLQSANWAEGVTGWRPGVVIRYRGSEEEKYYHRFGSGGDTEPLAILRDFDGLREQFLEISEEFRLFHNLYSDDGLSYYKYDEVGDNHRIASISDTRAQLRLKEIRQFCGAKDMALAIQFDCRKISKSPISTLGLDEVSTDDNREDLLIWNLVRRDSQGDGSFSRLLGLRFVRPTAKSETGLWGFSEPDKRGVDFIVGNTGGQTVMAQPGSGANFLTPVHFRKDVLDKYYAKPSRYEVRDNYVSCANLWSLTIDNHHDNKVVAWLGDLWRSLPYREQIYWKSFNIEPIGGVSKTFFDRQIEARFADSSRPEHNFQTRYREFISTCEEKLDWHLLRPLQEKDKHHQVTLRVPSTDEVRDLDEIVLSLTKVLIDSIDVRRIRSLLPEALSKDCTRGIDCLKLLLEDRGAENADPHIKFLRSLQRLRSKGVAHRKGRGYEKLLRDSGWSQMSERDIVRSLIEESVALLEFLTRMVDEGHFSEAD